MQARLHLSEILIKNSREHFKSNTKTKEDRFVSVIPFSSWLRPSALPARQDGHNVLCVLASGLLGKEDTIVITRLCGIFCEIWNYIVFFHFWITDRLGFSWLLVFGFW